MILQSKWEKDGSWRTKYNRINAAATITISKKKKNGPAAEET
jgi:hypothetical protein